MESENESIDGSIESEIDAEDTILREVVSGVNYGNNIHPFIELPLGRQYGCNKPLPYGSLMQISIGGWCKCRDFDEVRFIYNGACCVTNGGQFWEYIVEQSHYHSTKRAG
jgi:hypothetical protein